MSHYDLEVIGSSGSWQRIRWALFVFPDIVDVAPTDDPCVVRIFYEGTRPYPEVWRVELLQSGYAVPPLPTDRIGVEHPPGSRTGSHQHRDSREALSRLRLLDAR